MSHCWSIAREKKEGGTFSVKSDWVSMRCGTCTAKFMTAAGRIYLCERKRAKKPQAVGCDHFSLRYRSSDCGSESGVSLAGGAAWLPNSGACGESGAAAICWGG